MKKKEISKSSNEYDKNEDSKMDKPFLITQNVEFIEECCELNLQARLENEPCAHTNSYLRDKFLWCAKIPKASSMNSVGKFCRVKHET